ncbi:hypothetical protein PV356_35215 [Streptomyces sp. WI03-5b]|uniref:hypothetical protein n=1 Tax=Streptomyces sp. WI03-5b TaxID=462946 RepID=UPI0029A832CC|nr:hypothetical protein [Streptomyces sp. WI03-5b]MDX2624671.1 hypothetical protein [Streptomyces sp. WI03-5b]
MADRKALPAVTPAAAAQAYRQGQAAAQQGPRPSTQDTRIQLGSARTSGNQAAGSRGN